MKENYYLDDGTYSASQIVIEMVRSRQEGKGDVSDLLKQLQEPKDAQEFRLKLQVHTLAQLPRIKNFVGINTDMLCRCRYATVSMSGCGVSLEVVAQINCSSGSKSSVSRSSGGTCRTCKCKTWSHPQQWHKCCLISDSATWTLRLAPCVIPWPPVANLSFFASHMLCPHPQLPSQPHLLCAAKQLQGGRPGCLGAVPQLGAGRGGGR